MSKRTKRAQQGFSLLEMLVVVALAFTVMAFAVMNTMGSSQNARANAAMDMVLSQLRQARALAISKRRNVQVQFTAPNQIQMTLLTLPGEVVPPVIPPTFLNDGVAGGATFVVLPATDTPMGFGNSSAISLQQPTGGGAWSVMFTTSGAFCGTAQSAATLYQATSNNPVNASIFVGVAGKPNTARAVTVLGATGRVRSYYWTGVSWQE
jgi:prepilin-type N-terminal cleavage/methylation domain-containing protein